MVRISVNLGLESVLLFDPNNLLIIALTHQTRQSPMLNPSHTKCSSTLLCTNNLKCAGRVRVPGADPHKKPPSDILLN